MLLVDAVEQLSAGRGRASKLISADDECCERFGDGPPALPFTLVVDALGQVATMVLRAQDPAAASVWYLGSIESMTFHSPVLAGSVLQMEARILRRFQNTARIEVIALSEGMPVADGLMVLSQGGSTRDANR
jgi:3-hydroxymyristoyl/3-hydroxydecanoyl-(acyl carrier protein) dehydratase